MKVPGKETVLRQWSRWCYSDSATQHRVVAILMVTRMDTQTAEQRNEMEKDEDGSDDEGKKRYRSSYGSRFAQEDIILYWRLSCPCVANAYHPQVSLDSLSFFIRETKVRKDP
jgi:predicted dienelactone hydrolase